MRKERKQEWSEQERKSGLKEWKKEWSENKNGPSII